MKLQKNIEEKRFKPYAAAYLVLIKDKKILLSLRFNTGYQDGNYSLVSGHFNGGETAKECIIREAKEESDIRVDSKNLKVVHIMHRYRPAREYLDIYLRAEKWSGKIRNMEVDKCHGLDWFDMDNLPDNIAPEIRQALKNIKKHLHYSEIGWKTRNNK
jgi:ADP-ribose pyrophosphatase YjhB (NUDIX family)